MYSVIVIRTVGLNDSQIRSAMEAQLNTRADDGYRYVDSFENNNNLMFLILSKPQEVRRGRPRKDSDEVTTSEG